MKDAETAKQLGLDGKSWEIRRGGFYEVGCRAYKDGKVTHGVRETVAVAETKEVAPKAPVLMPPVAPKASKKASRRSRSLDD